MTEQVAAGLKKPLPQMRGRSTKPRTLTETRIEEAKGYIRSFLNGQSCLDSSIPAKTLYKQYKEDFIKRGYKPLLEWNENKNIFFALV